MLPFYCTPSYLNLSSTWKPCLIYVKVAGTWVVVHERRNVAGTWKP